MTILVNNDDGSSDTFEMSYNDWIETEPLEYYIPKKYPRWSSVVITLTRKEYDQ